MRLLFYVQIIFLINNTTLAQVDITKYATNDLFEAKPIITKELLEESTQEESISSYFESEINIGLEFWNTNQLDDAIHHFSLMTEMYPDVDFLHYYLGAVYYDKKNYDEAIESLKNSLDINPLILESRYLIGLIQIYKKEIKEAKKTMEGLINVPLYASYGYHGMGIIATQEKTYYKAKRMYEKCLREDSTFKEAYIPLTVIELGLNRNFKNSLKIMNKAVRLDSTWQQARIIRAMISVYESGTTDQFEKDLNTLIKQDPENFHYYTIRGYLDIELKDYRSAIDNFRTAFNLEVDTTNVGEYKFSTKIKRSKSLQSALNYYYENFNQFVGKSHDYIDRGICEFINKNMDKALVFYDSASNHQNSGIIDYLKAVLYESKWDGGLAAIQYYTSSLEKDSMNFMAYSNRAELYLGRKEYPSAFDDYNKMIKLMPKDKIGYKMRGVLFLQIGNYGKAYRDFTMAIFLDSIDSDLFYNRGTAAFYLKYYDKSIQDFNDVIREKPKDGEAYYMLSLNSFYKTDTLKSIALLDSASKYMKYKLNYHQELLTLSQKFNLIENMQNAHDRLVKYESWEIDHRLERGKFYYNNQEYEKALKDLKIVLKRNKSHAAGYFYLGKTQIAMGETKAGNKSIEKARKLGYAE